MEAKEQGKLTIGDDRGEQMANLSDNRHINDVIKSRFSRRSLLQNRPDPAAMGSIGGRLAAGSSSGGGPTSTLTTAPELTPTPTTDILMSLGAIPVSDDDTMLVPEGYSVDTIASWGHPTTGNPSHDLDNSGANQGDQVRWHHDGMYFVPIESMRPYEDSLAVGLLVVNHEYVEPRFTPTSAIGQTLSRSDVSMIEDGARDAEEVLKEMNAHGVSVFRIQKHEDTNGGYRWDTVADDLNHRVTALTPIEISGPVRGTDFVKTKYSPNGTMTRGTINNGAHGVTPWDTYLVAEENWADYFRNSTATEEERPREQSRYGVPHSAQTSRYGWELADEAPEANQERFSRFDVGSIGDSATEDYRNEPNSFGWIVEIDPFDPRSVPVKRSYLGRFAHEGIVFHEPEDGKPLVGYSGDNARHEYIYKYVSAQPYYAATAGGHLLDSGTLYVAKFNDDGTGKWLPLVYGVGPLTDANGFTSQADVLVNTRSAADTVGATKMDRPESGAIHPEHGTVYFNLNNTSGTEGGAANPREESRWGHIIHWDEANSDFSATQFDWDMFILPGPTDDSQFSGEPLNDDQIFNNPDGLWFDADGRLSPIFAHFPL